MTDVSKASLADIEEAMKDVVDPELGINVVDLGLVYDMYVDDDNVVTLDMTLTSAACPLTDVIEDQTRQALTMGPGDGLVKDFRITGCGCRPGALTRSPTTAASSCGRSASTCELFHRDLGVVVGHMQTSSAFVPTTTPRSLSHR
jgi:metal-sulfur cluster biosynthetic enzyme